MTFPYIFHDGNVASNRTKGEKMPKINILPKSIAELIAAGEVVERPASVVKELVENSIDAGAKSVAVEIKNGGIRYIRVTDDGCGIEADDVPKAFVSHATSKIKDASDLDSILTLGFRGEALPSVAAVSRLSMLTRTENSGEGVLFTVEGGENAQCTPAGCPVGTTVTVRDLFFNTPARMKFLKKDVTEGSCVADVVTKAALAHPEVRFSLIRDGKNVLSTSGNGKLLDAVYSVFGKSIADALIPCEYSGAAASVGGFISKPLNNRPNRNMQFFFVNGRNVRIPAAVPALDEAYKNSIMVGKFPMCFLNVSIAAEKVDVNVHPAKTEIRFSDEAKIFEVIYYAAKSALARGDCVRPSIKLGNASVLDAPKPETVQMSFAGVSRDTAVQPQQPYSVRKNNDVDAIPHTGTDTVRSHLSAGERVLEKATAVAASQGKSLAQGAAAWQSAAARQNESSAQREAAAKSTASAFFRQNGEAEAIVALHSSGIDPITIGNGKREVSSDTGYNVPWTKETDADISADGVRVEKNAASENSSFPYDSAELNPPTGMRLAQTGGSRDVCDGTDTDGFRIVGEIFKTYILAEKDSKLLIIDKHAAHERMIFNKMTEGERSEYSQVLLSPVTVILSGREYAAVTENIGIFAEAGFAVEDFGDGAVAVRECPTELTREDIPSLIVEIAGELMRGNTRARPERLERIRETAACRAAVKAGDRLKPEETYAFVRRLLAAESIRYCPHGRPVIYELSKHEIEKQFGRLG